MVCPISAFSRTRGAVVLVLALAIVPATGCSDDGPTTSGDGSSTGVATGTTSGPGTTVGSADSTSGGMGSTATASSSGEPVTDSGDTTQGVSATGDSSSSDGTTSSGSTTDASGGSTTDPTSGGSTTDDPSGGTTSSASTSGDPTDATTDGDTDGMDEVPDFSGDFLFVVSTPLDPTLPFQYVANFDYVPSGVGGGTLDLELQPLALDTGSSTTPRTFFGPPLVFPAIPVAPDGTFAVPVGILVVAAETNPLFFIDAQANNVNFSVQVLDADALCGTVTGALVFPVASSLDGTTLAAVRVVDVMPAGLPAMFPLACP